MHVFTPKNSKESELKPFFRTNDPTLEHDQPMDEPNAKPLECPKSLEHEKLGKLRFKAVEENNEKKKKSNKTRRGYGKKNKNDKGYKNVGFSILGTNANGISGKQESLKNTVNHFQPSVITVQETKLTRMGSIKLKGYQVFEKNR